MVNRIFAKFLDTVCLCGILLAMVRFIQSQSALLIPVPCALELGFSWRFGTRNADLSVCGYRPDKSGQNTPLPPPTLLISKYFQPDTFKVSGGSWGLLVRILLE
jgi:hypothetical protein